MEVYTGPTKIIPAHLFSGQTQAKAKVRAQPAADLSYASMALTIGSFGGLGHHIRVELRVVNVGLDASDGLHWDVVLVICLQLLQEPCMPQRHCMDPRPYMPAEPILCTALPDSSLYSGVERR